MFKKSYWAVGFFLISTLSFAQVALEPESHDFGLVRPGKDYVLKVKITNTLSVPVSLTSPSINSDGASIEIRKKVLASKAATWMVIDYHPKEGDNGPKVLNATFTASYHNDKKAVISRLQTFLLTAKVVPFYSFSPEKLIVSSVGGQKVSAVEGLLILESKTFSNWQLAKAESDSNTFTAQATVLSAPSTYSVRLSFTTSLPPGDYAGKITIKGLSGKVEKDFQYPYDIMVNSIWDVEPSDLRLVSADSKYLKIWKAHTTVRRRDGKSFKIVKIDNSPSWLKYDIAKASYGAGFLIHWSLDLAKFAEEQKANKPLSKAVTLVLDSPLEKTFSISLSVAAHQVKTISKTMLPLTEKDYQNMRAHRTPVAKPVSTPSTVTPQVTQTPKK